MTDALYFTPKQLLQPSEYIRLMRQQLIGLEEYDQIFQGKWSVEAMQAAADLVADRRVSWSTFRRVVWKVHD